MRKLSLGPLTGAKAVDELELESEADQLAAIFATIIMKVERRLAVSKAANRSRKL